MPIVKTFDKRELLISEDGAVEVIAALQQNKRFIMIAGEMIAASNISGIISGGLATQLKELPPGLIEDRTLEEIAFDDKSRAKGLLCGLKKYCDENPKAMTARSLYKEKLDKYKLTFGAVADVI